MAILFLGPLLSADDGLGLKPKDTRQREGRIVRGWKALSALVGAACLAPLRAAHAEPDTAKFFSDLQMKMVIRAAPGGSYDTYGRLLARHIGRHIPGSPTIVPINMPGASGIKAANYV